MLSENSYFKITLSRIATVIIAVVVSSFTIGMAWAGSQPNQEQIKEDKIEQKETKKQVFTIDKQLVKVSTILERIEVNQKNQEIAIENLDEKLHSVQTEVKIIAEKVNK